MPTTPSFQLLESGTYEVTVPLTFKEDNINYRFHHWEDNSLNIIRIIELTEGISITAMYSPLTVKRTAPAATKSQGRGNRHTLSSQYKTVIQTKNYVRHVLVPF